jgi:hypothetical protein
LGFLSIRQHRNERHFDFGYAEVGFSGVGEHFTFYCHALGFEAEDVFC